MELKGTAMGELLERFSSLSSKEDKEEIPMLADAWSWGSHPMAWREIGDTLRRAELKDRKNLKNLDP